MQLVEFLGYFSRLDGRATSPYLYFQAYTGTEDRGSWRMELRVPNRRAANGAQQAISDLTGSGNARWDSDSGDCNNLGSWWSTLGQAEPRVYYNWTASRLTDRKWQVVITFTGDADPTCNWASGRSDTLGKGVYCRCCCGLTDSACALGQTGSYADNDAFWVNWAFIAGSGGAVDSTEGFTIRESSTYNPSQGSASVKYRSPTAITWTIEAFPPAASPIPPTAPVFVGTAPKSRSHGAIDDTEVIVETGDDENLLDASMAAASVKFETQMQESRIAPSYHQGVMMSEALANTRQFGASTSFTVSRSLSEGSIYESAEFSASSEFQGTYADARRGLSTAAWIGIGVGAGFLTLLLALLLLLLLCRRAESEEEELRAVLDGQVGPEMAETENLFVTNENPMVSEASVSTEVSERLEGSRALGIILE